jgi:hypothetical protein
MPTSNPSTYSGIFSSIINKLNQLPSIKVIICITVLVSFIVSIYYYTRLSDTDNLKKKEALHNKKAESNFEIRGFRLNSVREGKRIISINADRFAIQKQSIGYFRFALLNEVRLENAFVVLYGVNDIKENIALETISFSQETASAPIGANDSKGSTASEALKFNNVFSEATLGLFPVKRIASIIIEQVSIELRNNYSVVSRISAESAIIRLKERDILFKNNVRVESDGKVLTADFLNFYPDKSTIETDQNFMFDTPQKRWEGKGLTTDIYLNLSSPR